VIDCQHSTPFFQHNSPRVLLDINGVKLLAVKSGSTPVRGPVKSGQKWMKGEGRGLDKRLVWLEMETAWIQRQGCQALIPCVGSSQGDGVRDRGGDRQRLE